MKVFSVRFTSTHAYILNGLCDVDAHVKRTCRNCDGKKCAMGLTMCVVDAGVRITLSHTGVVHWNSGSVTEQARMLACEDVVAAVRAMCGVRRSDYRADDETVPS